MNTLPRLKFAHLPTPVEALPRLSAALGGSTLLVKRDDQTGMAMGGNKTRKLEFLLAEAQAHGARTIVTDGAVQSNHCRQSAAAAARYGFQCILVLGGDRPSSASGNLLLDQLFGAEFVWVKHSEREQALRQTFDRAWEAGMRPYLIPYGGSNPTGAAAYAHAFLELVQQGYHPDWIVFASSSGGTQAGLVAGARLAGFQGRLLGISVDKPKRELQEQVASLASETIELLGEPATYLPHEILVNDDYVGAGYGIMGEAEKEAITLFARHEGLLLDPVYTGRAAAGMIDLIRGKFFKPDESVLFWHTGGTPALFAGQYQSNLTTS